LDLQLHAPASCPSALKFLPPTIYLRTRSMCQLASVILIAGEACFQKSPQGFLYHLDSTYTSQTASPPIALPSGVIDPFRSPQGLLPAWQQFLSDAHVSGVPSRLRCDASSCLSSQPGVLGGVRTSAPAASPSDGVLGGIPEVSYWVPVPLAPS
jgi:hypothetical protein